MPSGDGHMAVQGRYQMEVAGRHQPIDWVANLPPKYMGMVQHDFDRGGAQASGRAEQLAKSQAVEVNGRLRVLGKGKREVLLRAVIAPAGAKRTERRQP